MNNFEFICYNIAVRILKVIIRTLFFITLSRFTKAERFIKYT